MKAKEKKSYHSKRLTNRRLEQFSFTTNKFDLIWDDKSVTKKNRPTSLTTGT